MTTWKQIEGFPLYDVSNTGKVRSWRRHVRKWRNPHDDRRDFPIELTGTITPLGYIAFILRTPEHKVVRKTLHTLVGKAFLGDPPSPQHTDIAHNDGNPSNNHISNLRWATHQENQMDMRRHGKMQDGEKCCTCKLTESQVIDILTRYKDGRNKHDPGSGRNLAKEYGVQPSQISRIVNGKRWVYLHQS